MRRAAFRVLVTTTWLFAAGCAYVGYVLVVVGPTMGPRGDIDYVAFTEAQKHAADAEAWRTQSLGLALLVVAALSFFFGARVARRVINLLTKGKGEKTLTARRL